MAVNLVDSYQFGEIKINGRVYTSDVIVFPHRIKDDWWRKEGHELCLEDLREVIGAKPDVLVVGTGAYGRLKVLPEVGESFQAQGIELIAQPTEEACHTYNQLSASQKVIAALHLTC
jgi:hypothetical protein